MKASANLLASGKMSLALVPENGGIYRWPFHLSVNVCSTHTNSPFFVLLKRYAASLAIPKHGSSRSFAAQKNSLQHLWPNSLRLVRQEAAASSRPLLWRHTHLSGDRNSTGAVPVLRQSETRTTRLSGRQPVLHQAVCLVCGQAVLQQHGIGHCPRTASGLAYRQGAGQAIHDRARNTRTQGDWHRRNLDPQGAHLSHRGQRPDPTTPDLVWRRRPLGGQHATAL